MNPNLRPDGTLGPHLPQVLRSLGPEPLPGPVQGNDMLEPPVPPGRPQLRLTTTPSPPGAEDTPPLPQMSLDYETDTSLSLETRGASSIPPLLHSSIRADPTSVRPPS